MRSNAAYEKLESRPISERQKKAGVLSDTIIMLGHTHTKKVTRLKARLIEYYDQKSDRSFSFLTNDFRMAPATIAAIYEKRWAIEVLFKRIKQTAHDWEIPPSIVRLDEEDRGQIEDLLIGRKVTKVDDEHLLLDDGTVIKAIGVSGGCSCGAGDYDLSVLNGVDNAITRVEFDYAPAGDYEEPVRSGHPDDPKDEYTGYYRIFVYADNEKINLMQFDGSDGNGYYGTGFEILVRV
jgi:hypothetical protein